MEWNSSPGYTLRVVYTFLFAEILPTIQMTPTYAHTYTHGLARSRQHEFLASCRPVQQ